MHELVEFAINAHGGLDYWNRIRRMSAAVVPGGVALHLRGQAAFAKTSTRLTIDTKMQRATFEPFLAPGQIGFYEPYRTAVEKSDGTVLEELKNPRESFVQNAPQWTATQLAYFAGYAMWTYLTLPFSLLHEGVECEEISSWKEDGEAWRALKVTFPKSFVTHSAQQILYFDDKGLLRRQDYSVDIAGGGTAAHYLGDYLKFGGIFFATCRRIYPRGPDQKVDYSTVIMAADLSDFRFETSELAEINEYGRGFKDRFLAGVYEC